MRCLAKTYVQGPDTLIIIEQGEGPNDSEPLCTLSFDPAGLGAFIDELVHAYCQAKAWEEEHAS